MKNLFFLMFVFFTCQVWSQVKTGVYKSEISMEFQWDEGVQIGSSNIYNDSLLLHITQTGFRVYKKEGDTGNSYPLIYIGQDSEGFNIYAVPFGDRFEMKEDDIAVLFYNFDDTTGWYQSSIEYRSLSFLYEDPILE